MFPQWLEFVLCLIVGQEGQNRQEAVQIVFVDHMQVWSIYVGHDMDEEAVDVETLRVRLGCIWAWIYPKNPLYNASLGSALNNFFLPNLLKQ